MRFFFISFLVAAPHVALSESIQVLSERRMELSTLQIDGNLPACSGMLVAPDMIVTAKTCLFDASGAPRGSVSALPGLNMAEGAGPVASKPGFREFGIAAYDQGPAISTLRLGLVEGRPPPADYMKIAERDLDPVEGQALEVLHYAGDSQPVQAFTRCVVLEAEKVSGRLDCILPELAKGAPVLRDGAPVGIIQDPSSPDGAAYHLFPREGLEPVDTAAATALPIVTFSAVDVLNTCNVDIHQGVFWLDLDGESWHDIAKRVPANSRMILPAATVGDAIFSYARSDDGLLEWAGDDLQVEINGAALPMVQVPVPQPIGDLTLTYSCE